jgi:hypothetical protein
MRQWPRVRGIITWHPYLFTRSAYRPGAGRRAARPVGYEPFNGDPEETTHPETAWRALATVAERRTE